MHMNTGRVKSDNQKAEYILEKGGKVSWVRKHASQQDSKEWITSHRKNVG